MNTRSIGFISIGLNVALLAAIYFVAIKPKDGSVAAPSADVANSESKTNRKERNKFARPLVNQSGTNAAKAESGFDWAKLQARDFRTYIANLRAVDCPEETIRDIITAEVDKLYAGQLRSVLSGDDEFHYWKSQRPGRGKSAYESQQKRKDIEKEKSDLLVELLGVDPNKERNKEMGIIDYWARMYAFLPEGKQDQARTVQEKYEAQRQEIYRRGDLDDTDSKQLREIYKKQMEEMAQFMTPTELEQYELTSSQVASQLRYDLDGMTPTEEEFRAIFKVRKAHEEDLSGSYDPDDKAAQDKRNQAVKDSNKEIAAALSPERYAEYERAQDWNYKELVRLTEREELPKENAIKAFDLKKATDEAANKIRQDKELSSAQRNAALKELRDNTEKELTADLGERGFGKYKRRQGWWLDNISRSR